ncbi:MAG TPA: nucleotidyl transferase AbiEii/AbiGii toxin family protein [Chitinophagaceae bacterium]|nr:nucleotidyl transferase AbiEii/AbiGii toxin family protein [Chitinophagaceae bacterium]
MNNAAIQEWLKLTDQTRRNIFGETAAAIGLPPAAVEKDWWIVRTLELVFETSIASYTVFKGGTSLSKAWGLIDRFSEDIDLALDRKYLGIEKPDSEMTGSQVSKLRKLSGKFITEKYFPELTEKFNAAGLKVNVQVAEVKSDDQDPLIIEVYYQSLTDPITYLQPRVLIEVGSRSLIEPYEERSFTSMVGEKYKGQEFADENILIPSVNPQRTFLEKIFLLHEEFQLPAEKIRVERKSRHLYDLEKLMDTDYAIAALTNRELYDIIVEHRKKLTPLRGIDYANHTPDKINPIPPDAIIGAWEKDYQIMQESMLFNPSLSFEQLILRIKTLKERINAIKR